MAYKVTKNIPINDGSFIPVGEIVDALGWRNLKSLISNRFLLPLAEPTSSPDEKPKGKVSSVKK